MDLNNPKTMAEVTIIAVGVMSIARLVMIALTINNQRRTKAISTEIVVYLSVLWGPLLVLTGTEKPELGVEVLNLTLLQLVSFLVALCSGFLISKKVVIAMIADSRESKRALYWALVLIVSTIVGSLVCLAISLSTAIIFLIGIGVGAVYFLVQDTFSDIAKFVNGS